VPGAGGHTFGRDDVPVLPKRPSLGGMQERILGRTGAPVGVVGLGAWQLGADWGEVDEDQALATLAAAHEAGVTFIDTADVYGDGRSERLVGQFVRGLPAQGAGGRGVMVATKMGRRVPQEAERYNLDNFRAWNDRSRENLGVDTIDLVQLHCPPSAVYSADEVFDGLDLMVQEGRMKAYGVSVETAAEALTAIARPGVATVQIIFNMLRLKPLDDVLPAAQKMGVGIIARVPLASGLLSGRYDEHTTFGADDHRTYNRHGAAFDQGETFSGVDYDTGLAAVRRLATLRPEGLSMTQFALRWIIDHPAVSVVIPGARNAEQARANAAAGGAAALPDDVHDAVRDVYDQLVRPSVHSRW
jgi:aryl-alcohol dehydrogenase-like predicted oxidoreductase